MALAVKTVAFRDLYFEARIIECWSHGHEVTPGVWCRDMNLLVTTENESHVNNYDQKGCGVLKAVVLLCLFAGI